MPAAALRTPEAAAFRQRVQDESEGFWGDIGRGAKGVGVAGIGLADVVTGIPSFVRDPSLANAGWVATSVVPGGKLLKGASTAVNTGKRLTGSRHLGYRGARAQMASSPSTITANAQRLIADPVAGALGRKVDELREGGRVAQAAGKALTPVSSRSRVPKRAAKLQKWEQGRRRAAVSPELAKIMRVKRSSRSAHFWWAQMPKEYWNKEGLRLVRDKYQQNLDDLMSGRLLQRLDEELQQAVAAGDQQMEDWLGLRIRHLADERRDLQRAVRKMDDLMRSNVKVDEGVIDSVRVLMGQREEILRQAGMLGDSALVDRPGILADWIGRHNMPGARNFDDLPYVGHRPAKGGRASTGITLRGFTTGKTRRPAGVGQHNDLVLANTGRIRDDIRVVLEDWQSAQVYDFANRAKADLIKMGEPVVAGVKPDHVLINPTGKRIPKTWRIDVGQQMEEIGYPPEIIDDIADGIEGITDTFAVTPDEITRIIRHATEHGYYRDLVQVPEDVVQRYFGQIVSPKAIKGVNQQFGRALGKLGDTVNNIVYASLIYANPGYIPANLLGNALFGALHQGVFLPANLIRAGQLLAKASPRLRAQVLNEVDQGAMVAVASGGMDQFNKGIRKSARFLGHISDSGPRVAALVHEAQRVGVIGKKPWLTDADMKAFERFLNDPQYRAVLNDAKERGTQAMVDFTGRLGPWENAFAKRLLFVWPWIRGATAYPVRFAMDYPLRSAAMGYVAAGGELPDRLGPIEDVREEAYDRHMQDMPAYLDEAFQVGETVVDGTPYPVVSNVGPFSPVGTAYDVIRSATGQPGADTLVDFLNPLAGAAYNTLDKRDAFGRETDSYREALLSNAERLAPNVGLARDLISPEGGGMYPEDATRWGRTKRALRFATYAVDPEEARAAAVREGSVESNTLPPERKSSIRRRNLLEKFFGSVGREVPPQLLEVEAVMEEVHRESNEAEGKLKKQLDVDKLTDEQETRVLAAIIVPIFARENNLPESWVKTTLAKIKKAPPSVVREAISSFETGLGFNALEGVLRRMGEISDYQRDKEFVTGG
jgi:hypothetical protein